MEKFISFGPDGTLTGVLVLIFLAVVFLLLLSLPPTLFFAVSQLVRDSRQRNSANAAITFLGVCTWLALAWWAFFVFWPKTFGS